MSSPLRARETALRLLFQWEMTKETPERAKQLYWQMAKADKRERKLADALFDSVISRVGEIDRLLQAHTEEWRLERLSAVDRNILRLATGEFLSRPAVHARSIIALALEIAQMYSSGESAHFINGVLDGVRRELGLELGDSKQEHKTGKTRT